MSNTWRTSIESFGNHRCFKPQQNDAESITKSGRQQQHEIAGRWYATAPSSHFKHGVNIQPVAWNDGAPVKQNRETTGSL